MYEKTCRTVFDLESIVRQKERLEARTTDPGFWKSEESREVTREISRLQRSLDGWNEVERMYGDLAALDELLSEDDDAELQREFDRTAEKLRRFAEKEQMLILLSEEHDAENAILTIHAGSGGWTPRTGPRCCCGSICAGSSERASPERYWTSSRTRRPA